MDARETISTNDSRAQASRVDALNQRYAEVDAHTIMRAACVEMFFDRVALVSSFGAEAAVLLHLMARIAPSTPVIFLDTLKHFPETTNYVRELAGELGLGVVVNAFPGKAQIESDDPKGDLHQRDSDLCCHVRKTMPLLRALRPYDAYFTGRKQSQTEDRQAMTPFEGYGRWIRINPLWNWSPDDIEGYFEEHGLPRHPLYEKGYLSIGCAPCTRAVREGEDARAGRWADSDKTECGIHVDENGRVVRGDAG